MSRRTQMGMPGGAGRYLAPQRMPFAESEWQRLAAAGDVGPKTTRSPLTDTFPVFRQLRTSWRRLPNPPAGLNFTGSMAIFPLINIAASAFDVQDVLLASVHTVLGSTGNTDSAQQGQAWGTPEGIGAAIAVIRNMPGLPPATGLASSWTRATLPIGWIDEVLPVATPGFAPEDTTLVWATPFAPGNRQTSPSRVDAAEDFPPHVMRYTQQDRFQVVFVLNAAQANVAAGVSNFIRGLCEVRLRIGLSFTQVGLERT